MRSCDTCVHSWTNPDGLVCSHPNSGHFGMYTKEAQREHCGTALLNWEGKEPKRSFWRGLFKC